MSRFPLVRHGNTNDGRTDGRDGPKLSSRCVLASLSLGTDDRNRSGQELL